MVLLGQPEQQYQVGGGTTSDAFVIAYTTDATATKNYDGTSWAAGNASNSGHNYGGAGGIATAGLVFGGTNYPNPGVRNGAERFDGTCWTTDASMNEARSNAHGKASVTGGNALCATGNPGPPGYTNANESYQGAGPVTQTITTT